MFTNEALGMMYRETQERLDDAVLTSIRTGQDLSDMIDHYKAILKEYGSQVMVN